MQKNILITGKPKSGKSTLLCNLISGIADKVGFVTNEILGNEGRLGFEIETYTGHKATLAHVDLKTEHQVGKYFVDIKSLESLIPSVCDFNTNSLLYLDEIGEMQLFSNKFKDLVWQYLNSQNTCLATISYVFDNDFTRSIKERNDIILVEISPEDREEKEEFLKQLVKKIEKAKKYITENKRFKVSESTVELRSEHGLRQLVLANGKWSCDCDFFKKYEICSHAIATKEVVV